MLSIKKTLAGVPETFVRLSDADAQLDGVIVMHSTRLGPAAGGCRFWHYPRSSDAHADALRLAEGMAYKNALAGLPLGGGKAVLKLPDGPFDRGRLMRAFGDAIKQLRGEYITAEDVGTSVSDMAEIRKRTRHVAGLSKQDGQPGGDPSPWTALGVFESMKVAVNHRLGKGLNEVSVLVQGVGHVGYALCKHLHEAGARLVVVDPRRGLAAKAARDFSATVVRCRSLDISEVQVDVFAPCALGGALSDDVAARLRAKVVCGAANNQLGSPAVAKTLARRDILYAPDYLVNAGGIINVAAEYLGWSETEVSERVSAIPARLESILEDAAKHGLSPDVAADNRALQIIAEGRNTLSCAAA